MHWFFHILPMSFPFRLHAPLGLLSPHEEWTLANSTSVKLLSIARWLYHLDTIHWFVESTVQRINHGKNLWLNRFHSKYLKFIDFYWRREIDQADENHSAFTKKFYSIFISIKDNIIVFLIVLGDLSVLLSEVDKCLKSVPSPELCTISVFTSKQTRWKTEEEGVCESIQGLPFLSAL